MLVRMIIFLSLGALGFWIYDKIQDEFSYANITFDQPLAADWDLPPLPLDKLNVVDSILNQKFTYLDKGRQSYAFLSEDGKYVIKFIKFTYLKPPLWVRFPSFPFLKTFQNKWKKGQRKRLERIFSGYQLAYSYDKENSGLIYIHLKQPEMKNKKVTVIDRFRLTTTLDLESILFILQEKGIQTKQVFKELRKRGDLTMLKLRIGQILELYVSEYQKGLYDSDHNVLANTAFTGNGFIRIDAGRLKFDERMKNPLVFKEDLRKVTHGRLAKWIKSNFPADEKEILEEMEKMVHDLIKSL